MARALNSLGWLSPRNDASRKVTKLHDGDGLEVGPISAAVITLADRSRLELTPGSMVELRGPTNGLRQLILLSAGTGLFDVSKSQGLFQVETPLGKITVLGTEFTVALRPADEFEATLTHQEPSMKTKSMKMTVFTN